MKNKSGIMCKVIGILRILLGLSLLYFGISKIGASAEMIEMIGGAGHDMGLTFLSVKAWYWIAMVGELVAGLLLLLGHWYRVGAVLALIVMVFALNSMGIHANAVIVAIVSLIVLIRGPGARCICRCKKCKGCCGSVCKDKMGDTCCGGDCSEEDMKAKQQQGQHNQQ